MSSPRIPRRLEPPPYGTRDPLPILRFRSSLPGSRRTSGISLGSDVITNTGWRSGVRYFAWFPGNTSSLDREYGARFFWSSVPAAISSTSLPAMIWKTVGRVRAGLIAGGTAATLAEGGAPDDDDSLREPRLDHLDDCLIRHHLLRESRRRREQQLQQNHGDPERSHGHRTLGPGSERVNGKNRSDGQLSHEWVAAAESDCP